MSLRNIVTSFHFYFEMLVWKTQNIIYGTTEYLINHEVNYVLIFVQIWGNCNPTSSLQVHLSQPWSGARGGGVLNKCLYGKAPTRGSTLTLLYTIFSFFSFFFLLLKNGTPSYLLPLFIKYRRSGEKLIKYQTNSSCVIMFVILMTTLFYKALILQGEIWCWSLLGLNLRGL